MLEPAGQRAAPYELAGQSPVAMQITSYDGTTETHTFAIVSSEPSVSRYLHRILRMQLYQPLAGRHSL